VKTRIALAGCLLCAAPAAAQQWRKHDGLPPPARIGPDAAPPSYVGQTRGEDKPVVAVPTEFSQFVPSGAQEEPPAVGPLKHFPSHPSGFEEAQAMFDRTAVPLGKLFGEAAYQIAGILFEDGVVDAGAEPRAQMMFAASPSHSWSLKSAPSLYRKEPIKGSPSGAVKVDCGNPSPDPPDFTLRESVPDSLGGTLEVSYQYRLKAVPVILKLSNDVRLDRQIFLLAKVHECSAAYEKDGKTIRYTSSPRNYVVALSMSYGFIPKADAQEYQKEQDAYLKQFLSSAK